MNEQTQQQPPVVLTTYTYESQQPCCGGYADRFNVKAGRVTGVLLLVLGLVVIAVSVPHIILVQNYSYSGFGTAIGSVVFLWTPTGIVGVCTKSKKKSVVIAYLVMTITTAVSCFSVVAKEGEAAGLYSYTYPCDNPFDMMSCFFGRLVPAAVALHAACAFVCLVEGVVAIVASVYCSRALDFCAAHCGCCYGQRGASTEGGTSDGQGATSSVVQPDSA